MANQPAAAGGPKSELPRAAHRKVPSFLSILKVLYKTTRLYLGLLALFAGIPAVVISVASKWKIPIWIAAVFSVVPAGLILLWLIPTWLEQKNKRRMEVLGIHGQIKDPEYFRLAPYDSASDFRRADNMHQKVYAWLIGNPAPLLYLSGASGSGKSSIISAWVFPKLAGEGAGTHVVSARGVGNPIAAITQVLLTPGAIWERPPSGGTESLRELLVRATKKAAPKKLLVVLDQFEEFLILAEGEQRAAFTEFLHSLAEAPVRNLQVLMILRNDYLALLDALGLPESAKDRKEIPPFLERDAMAFLRKSGLKISPELENEIREEAREVEQTPGLIRPITINLFGLVVRRFEVLPQNYWRGTLLRSYLRGLIQRREIRDFAPQILHCMMTGNGMKKPVSTIEIAGAVGLNPNQVRGYLVPLASEGVVRELDHDQGKWEIAHDFIAALYHQILAAWRISAWRRARPWVIGGGIGFWLVALFVMPIFVSAWQEDQEKQALINLGFSLERCDLSAIAQVCLRLVRMERETPDQVDHVLVAAIPHLMRLNRIYSLDLSDNVIQDIAPLKGLSGLGGLNLSNDDVGNINALKGMTGLQTLILRRTKVENVDALKGLSGLRRLDLGHNPQIDNIDMLKGLNGLQWLDLSEVQVENVDSLKGLLSLQTLNLSDAPVKNIDALKGLSGLQTLDLSNAQVENIDALKGLSGLQTLDLSFTQVKNIDALKGLSGLQTLNLDGTKVENFDAIKGLSGLRTLDVDLTNTKNVDELKAALPKAKVKESGKVRF